MAVLGRVKGKRTLLGSKKRFQLPPSQGHFLRGGVKERIQVGGWITLVTQPGGNCNQAMVEKNPQILFDSRPAKGKLLRNQSNAGVADTRLSISMAGKHVVDSNANGADLL